MPTTARPHLSMYRASVEARRIGAIGLFYMTPFDVMLDDGDALEKQHAEVLRVVRQKGYEPRNILALARAR